ncbi:AAA family ATPase [Heliobacillus mobilis]|uniref:AAA family ATPase n=1 Tax=Heliobacterium mobile TaxID=28064 RepID=A0A6I3SMX8_HELMO|nr:ATP-binding protein [Heliobacterium mobile]MTV50351.1 AAA family ATPase [Heliobacterium mobile]
MNTYKVEQEVEIPRIERVVGQSPFRCVYVMNQGYRNIHDHLVDELELLKLRIRRLLLIRQTGRPESPPRPFKGLVVSDEEVEQLLGNHPIHPESHEDIRRMTEEIDLWTRQIQSKREWSQKKGLRLPLDHLSQTFSLSPLEEQCILLCLALECDCRYEKLYAYLQDDLNCKYPTADLAMQLLCSTGEERRLLQLALLPSSVLFRSQILRFEPGTGSIYKRALYLEEGVLSFLLGGEQLDRQIESFVDLFHEDDRPDELIAGQEIQSKLRRFTGKQGIYYLWGPAGSGKTLHVRHLSAFLKRPLLIAHLDRMFMPLDRFREILQLLFREARLRNAVLCFANVHTLIEESDPSLKESRMPQGSLHTLLRQIPSFPGMIFMLADRVWKPSGFHHSVAFLAVELKAPDQLDRIRLWETFAQEYQFVSPLDWAALAGKFRFTAGQIREALMTAQTLANWNPSDRSGESPIHSKDLHQACLSVSDHKLADKATRIRLNYRWEELVLPRAQKEQLKSACNHVRYRHIVYGQWGFEQKLPYGKGLSMLFAGPPGTGKTMAAQVVAQELQLELYKIDLSQVVSKYVGETEKNLRQVYQEAQRSNAILFFDECDALFGKRSDVKDSHDRYANIQTAFLLQKAEEYDGISILATNLSKHIDDAFLRRFTYVIDFPFPDGEYREIIWRSMFTQDTPVSDDIDFEFLSTQFEIAGGNIKNIVVAAAFLAAEQSEPIGMKHLIHAAKQEMQKIGKLLFQDALGTYSGF